MTTPRQIGKYQVLREIASGQTRLTDHHVWDGKPSWSPDGLKITFESLRDGNNEIYVMDADGSGQKNFTNNPANDTYPDWGPAR